MNYSDFSVEDLASDERFINWVKDDCSDEEKEFWRFLALSYPELQERIDRARILVINVNRAEDKIDPVDPRKVDEIWQNVLAGMEDENVESNDKIINVPAAGFEPNSVPQRDRSRWRLAVAASAALLVCAFFLLRKNSDQAPHWYSYQQDAPGFTEFVNTTENPVQLLIMDGSVISLEGNSRVKYKKDYALDTIRKVYLEGAAFFDVVRDPTKPFVVFTNDVATEVLGTSFRVNADVSTKNVVVSVKTGKVSVYSVIKQSATSTDRKDGVIVLPNQEVVYTDEQGFFEKKIVDAPRLLVPPSEDSFVFKHAPIATVFGKLEDAYGVEILFDRETMKNCFLTAPLGSEPLFDKLTVICRTIGASYEVIDAKVVITSAGCKTINPGKIK
ncbi:MAG TPA: FecR domain-containing protein [Chryseosolibacter sp.]|nr:FecR domain-containing protein [Chryseosolibacter sp.]